MARKVASVDELAQQLVGLEWEASAARLGRVWVVRCRKGGKKLTVYGSTEEEVWQEAVKLAETNLLPPLQTRNGKSAKPR